MIVAAIATMPARLPVLQRAVDSIRPQVDTLHVYLNGFDRQPNFLSDSEVVFSQKAAGDLGDVGKFYWFSQGLYSYYLTIDDDILYPPDYARTLIGEFEARDRKAIVGLHGFVFDSPIHSYVHDRKGKYKHTRRLDHAKAVHVIGTGTAILHPDTIRLSLGDFPRRNMADLQLAIAAQRQRVPMVVIPRPAQWTKEIPFGGSSIWESTKQDDGKALAAIARSEINHWQTFSDPLCS